MTFQLIKEYTTNKKKAFREASAAFERPPRLVIVQVGHDPASDVYVRNKKKDMPEAGMVGDIISLPETVSQEELLKLILNLNGDETVDGILVQLPLPEGLDEKAVMRTVDPQKDVDGFHKLSPVFPCTPQGIVSYLDDMGFSFQGKNAVVIGRSDIVGKPMAELLTARDMNVTLLHSKTTEEDKRFYIAHADLIVVAVGHSNTLTDAYTYREECVVIDVGINRNAEGKLSGDAAPGLPVLFQSPVPGGVGLLTRLTVCENLLKLCQDKIK